MSSRFREPLITSLAAHETYNERQSLPAEVVSRKRKEERKEEPKAPPIEIDKGKVHSMKPGQRVKWLMKVLQGLQQGRVQSGSIYDVVAHAKFVEGVSEKTGVKMYKVVSAHLAIFSNRQRSYLERECKLAEKFRERALEENEKSRRTRDGKSPSSGSSSSPDRGGPRNPAASRRGELLRVWDRISTLGAEERQTACDELDDEMKDMLEEFLVSRLGARAEAIGKEPRSDSEPRAGRPRDGERSGSRGRRSRSRSGDNRGGLRYRSRSHSRTGR